jgi:nicotinamidase/pyrazinamidase
MGKALLIVDMQKDFVNGSLPVPNAIEIIPAIYWIVGNVKYDCIIETFDWHPENHISFKQWGIHCLQNSDGAKSVLDFKVNNVYPSFFSVHKGTIRKGTNIDVDSYSGFFDNLYTAGTGLEEKLRKIILEKDRIDEIDIVGLATDYCVKFTAIDAAKLGYKTNVISFACRGVGAVTTVNAIEEMKTKYNINIV